MCFNLIQQIEANFSHDKFLSLDRENWRLKAENAPAGGMTATGIHLLDLSVRLLPLGETRDELIASKYRTREAIAELAKALR